MILVTGATGSIGAEVCRILKNKNVPFRAMCRKKEQVDSFRNQGITAVLGDFDKPESLKRAFKGCTKLFLITPPAQNQVEQECSAIEAAKKAGIQRIVKISASDSNVRSTVPWAKSHALIDHCLRESGVSWTILKPTAFMQNFLWFKKPISKGFIPLVSGKGSVSWVDKEDVGRVAAEVLTTDGHESATYFLTGPETLDMNEAAQRITKLTDHKVSYIDLPSKVFQLFLRITGNSEWMAKGLVTQFADVVAGHHDIDPTFEIERITGKPARSFDDFVRSNQTEFSKG